MNVKHIFRHPGSVFLIINSFWGKLIAELEGAVYKWALKSPRRASFYYCFFSTRFDREHYSVLKGISLNIDNDIDSLACYSSLRRNIHRLEKGLISDKIKPIFAGEYIENTLNLFDLVLEKKESGEITNRWIVDVLTKYFETVQRTEKILKAETTFNQLKLRFPRMLTDHEHGEYHGPYIKKDIKTSSINFEQFYELCEQRHSIRWYEDIDVPIGKVKKAIKLGLTAPSACNRQPFRFIIIQDKDKLKVMTRLPGGAKTFANNIRLLVVLVGDLSAYFDERDRHLIYIDGGLAAMNFMLGLETLGLSSCPINWPDIEKNEMVIQKELCLNVWEKGILFFSIGYPLEHGGIPFSAKKTVDEVVAVI